MTKRNKVVPSRSGLKGLSRGQYEYGDDRIIGLSDGLRSALRDLASLDGKLKQLSASADQGAVSSAQIAEALDRIHTVGPGRGFYELDSYGDVYRRLLAVLHFPQASPDSRYVRRIQTSRRFARRVVSP